MAWIAARGNDPSRAGASAASAAGAAGQYLRLMFEALLLSGGKRRTPKYEMHTDGFRASATGKPSSAHITPAGTRHRRIRGQRAEIRNQRFDVRRSMLGVRCSPRHGQSVLWRTRRMERAGKPRHRSQNPRGDGERAGCDRINPCFGGFAFAPFQSPLPDSTLQSFNAFNFGLFNAGLPPDIETVTFLLKWTLPLL